MSDWLSVIGFVLLVILAWLLIAVGAGWLMTLAWNASVVETLSHICPIPPATTTQGMAFLGVVCLLGATWEFGKRMNNNRKVE